MSIQHREQNQTSGVITYKHFCGGVLLQVFNRTGYVITASHCMVNMYEGFWMRIDFFSSKQFDVIFGDMFFLRSKDEDISVVFGAKNLKSYDGERYNTVSVHKRDYDR